MLPGAVFGRRDIMTADGGKLTPDVTRLSLRQISTI
jgi:hypothetical protein